MNDSYVGKIQAFVSGGKMVPYEVIRDADGILFLRSLDLMWTTHCSREYWDKQARILDGFEPPSGFWRCFHCHSWTGVEYSVCTCCHTQRRGMEPMKPYQA